MKKTLSGLVLLTAMALKAQAGGGRFVQANLMIEGRQGHTATLLNDGRVLIVGGTCGPGDTWCKYTAELFDPNTGSFSRTGQMAANRHNHAATLLPDGRVLVVGGTPAGNVPPPEIYDPETGMFTRVDLPPVEAPAILLNDGRVLLTGIQSLVLYEPLTGATSTVALPFDLRSNSALVKLSRLANGDILFAGYTPDFRFSPRDNRITFVPGKSVRLTNHTANLLSDGRVFLAGGLMSGYLTTRQVELYDPEADSIAASAVLSVDHASHSATLLPDGNVLIVGGSFERYGLEMIFTVAELFDTKTNQAQLTSSLNFARSGHTATLLTDGRVLIAGGGGEIDPPVRYAELYEPANRIPAASLYSSADGSGAILHGGSSRLVTTEDPAEPGEVLELYGTGLIEGSVIPALVFIGGRAAEVLYFGKSPGYDQINVRVPAGITPGSAISVRMNYMDRPSNAVTLAVR
jgi:hypothetical protein